MRRAFDKAAGARALSTPGGAARATGSAPFGRVADRIASGTLLTIGGYFGSQMVRLIGNLVLSRILFPEAFGLMTLVTVVFVGVAMFSDIGIAPSIQQSKRGDDQDFLDTAWTIQVIRNVLLWIACCILSWPAALFFGEPMLAQLLPVAGFAFVFLGFLPTRTHTAARHLLIGRLTVIELLSHALGLVAMVILALITRSVWALPIGNVIGSLIKLILMDRYLPGPRNRFRWEKEARHELVRFGKWIFLSTAFNFLLSQSDKIILGKFLTIEGIGIYNVGFFIATAPMAIAIAVNGRLMLPLCRDHPPGKDPADFALVRRIRMRFSVVVAASQIALALLGVAIIDILYDDRFLASGGVVVAVALMNLPYLIGITYEAVAFAAGDSRAVFFLNFTRAVLQTGLFLLGITYWGLEGAFLGFALAHVLAHGVVIHLARKHGGWDPLHDAAMALISLAGAALALWLHGAELSALAGFLP
ncbi:oligosaccharide flippase family protein [Defluviimonas sp. WL0075]|uniref:Oligosaccharide flippase family protein n=1 Tax=Albidovulum sediminicola TaxID=2984331 RepID=A0ABT2YYW7_9RHOB|nr:oligosaccharide flippase family protein [Defluviimonas sp. WL0075]